MDTFVRCHVPYCYQIFKDRPLLQFHCSDRHGLILCCVCTWRSFTIAEDDQHYASCHVLKRSQRIRVLGQKNTPMGLTPKGIPVREVTSSQNSNNNNQKQQTFLKTFRNKGQMESPLKAIQKKSTQTHFKIKITGGNKVSNICSECDREFSTPEALSQHLRVHKVPCPACDKTFEYPCYMKRHLRNSHGKMHV